MGRLPPVAVVSTLMLACGLVTACDAPASSAASGPSTMRAEKVRAVGAVAVTSPGPSVVAVSGSDAAVGPHAASIRKSRLCDSQIEQPGRAVSWRRLPHREAAGVDALPDKPAGVSGRWTWINLWAAYCGPCRQEMPLLRSWSTRLESPITWVFVSMDDDERQMIEFLAGQPTTGVRASYWASEGAPRDGFLSAMRMRGVPELPVQLLIDPKGELRCVIEGAIDEADFARVREISAMR